MAHVGKYICKKCLSTVIGIICEDRICPSCAEKLATLEREAHFRFLDSLTMEQRLRKVEDWVYNYKPEYVPAPKYGSSVIPENPMFD